MYPCALLSHIDLLYCSIAVCRKKNPLAVMCGNIVFLYPVQLCVSTHTVENSNICSMQTLQSECVLAVQHCLLYQSDQSYCKQYRANNIQCPFLKRERRRQKRKTFKKMVVFFWGNASGAHLCKTCRLINSVLVGFKRVVVWLLYGY